MLFKDLVIRLKMATVPSITTKASLFGFHDESLYFCLHRSVFGLFAKNDPGKSIMTHREKIRVRPDLLRTVDV